MTTVERRRVLKNRPCSKGIATRPPISRTANTLIEKPSLLQRDCDLCVFLGKANTGIEKPSLLQRDCDVLNPSSANVESIEKPSLLQRDYDLAVPTWAASCLDFGLETRPCCNGFSIKNADIRRHFFIGDARVGCTARFRRRVQVISLPLPPAPPARFL